MITRLAHSTSSIDQTKHLLNEWGRWAMVNPGVSINYPNATNFARLIPKKGVTPSISDTEAEVIDAAVACLCQRITELGDIVVMYYLIGFNSKKIAEIKDVDRRVVTTLLRSGEAWIDAKING